MNEAINYVMLLVIFGIVTALFCIRRSPQAMMAIAAWLMSTTEADIARAKYHAKRHAAWRQTLGIEDSGRLVQDGDEA